MSNPYQSPAFDPKQFQDLPQYAASYSHDFGWISHVRIFAVLNAVQGGLEIVMGLFAAGLGIAFPTLIERDLANHPGRAAGNDPPPEFLWIMGIVYLVIGAVVLTAGIMRIVAGVRNYRFRGRIAAITSLILGMGSVFSCYCAPTGIALLVYGLMVLLNPAVKSAFAMAENGPSPHQILAAFFPYRPMPYAAPSMPDEPPGSPFR